ncbi:MAG: S-methyl-5-thioribose-1-phosphate isomerase [Fimbriimonadaceae bacterium]|nr:S-methyl-5-thioribose-1-phosphate isomerase [Fimbriimonadaceae bacterium]
MAIRALEWRAGALHLLDQRELPHREVWLEFMEWTSVAEAIRNMVVRGAPAIGVTAAYGMALAAQAGDDLIVAASGLRASRPTAVNLFWALDRIEALQTTDPAVILSEAVNIDDEDLQMNLAIGQFGAELVPPGARILTICNTGSLATSGHGTALGIIRSAYALDPSIAVISCETRPRLQGLKLTAWELQKDGIPFKSISDSAAASLMAQGRVDLVVVGADRIASNGDTANKIGTYSLAIAAKYHGIPFVVAAPSSTIDLEVTRGNQIPIEEREGSEITHLDGIAIAPAGCPTWNPGFDITPSGLISAIVTEQGIYNPPFGF